MADTDLTASAHPDPGRWGAGGAPGVLARTPSGILVVTGITSVQFGSAIAARLFSTVGPGGAVLLRVVVGAIVLLVVWRPSVRARTRRELLLAALFGLILAGMNTSFYEAIQRLPLGIAVTIEFLGPLGVAVLGSRRPLDLLWVALAAVGIVALTRSGAHGLDPLGVGFVLLAAACWAFYILVNARVGRAFEGGTGLALAMITASVLVLPLGLAQAGVELIKLHSLLLGAAVGMLSCAIPYSCEIEALRRISPSVFGVLMSLEPAAAAMAGLIVLGQGLSARALIGIALVIIACVGASRRAAEARVGI